MPVHHFGTKSHIFCFSSTLLTGNCTKINKKSQLLRARITTYNLNKMKIAENKKVFIFHTLVIWILYVLMFYVTIFSFNELEHLSFGAVLVAFIMASFSIVATNGGIGSYPLAIFAAFSLYGISKEPSIAFGWIVWGAQTLMIVVLGGLSFIIQPIVNRIK